MLNSLKKLTALAVLSAAPYAAFADQAPADVDVAIGLDSEYIWRGTDFGDFLAWFDVSKSFAITDELSVTAGVWNANTFDGTTDEVDFYASTDLSAFGVDFSAGVIYYAFYGDSSDQVEFVLSSAYTLDIGEAGAIDLGGALIFTDEAGTDGDKGSAFTLDASYSIMGATATLTYSFPFEKSGYTPEYWNLAVGYDFELGLATVSPYIAYADGQEDGPGEASGYEGIYYGVSAAMSF